MKAKPKYCTIEAGIYLSSAPNEPRSTKSLKIRAAD